MLETQKVSNKEGMHITNGMAFGVVRVRSSMRCITKIDMFNSCIGVHVDLANYLVG